MGFWYEIYFCYDSHADRVFRNQNVNDAVWVTVFLAVVICINMFGAGTSATSIHTPTYALNTFRSCLWRS